MLTALPNLSAPPKSDLAPVATARPSAPTVGDNSFANLIRRQAEQRLDALRLADQQALAARVSAAAATPMPRPIVEPLASRPPRPGQTPADPGPPPPPTSTSTSVAAALPSRAKTPSSAGRPEASRSPATPSGPADSPTANRAVREPKPGMAPGAEVAAEDAAINTAGLPLALAATGPAGLVGGAAAQDPGADLQPAQVLPLELAAWPTPQAATGPGVPAGPGDQPADGPGQAEARSVGERLRAAPGRITAEQANRSAPSQPPLPGLAGDPAPAIGIAASPALAQARKGAAPSLSADPSSTGGDDLEAAASGPARRLDPRSEPATDKPEDRRLRGPNGPDGLLPAQRDAATTAALPVTWGPGPTPASGASGASSAAPAEPQPTSRRAGATIDRKTPEPLDAAGAVAVRPGPAGTAALDGLSAAAPMALARPVGAAPQGFDTALQAVLAQGTPPPGISSGAGRSGEPTLSVQIDAPVDSPLFAPVLGSQLSLLARDGVRSALLQLHPAEMGPISVEIALDGNAAHIDFQALRADTRGLIEASLPALAGALQDAGLTLAGGGVFEQAPGRQPQAQAEQGPGARQTGRTDTGATGQHDAPPQARRPAPRGLVDLVA